MFGRLLAALRDWWTLEDPEERIEGSGEVHLDPAYNGRYEAERALQRARLLEAEGDAEDEGLSRQE